MAGQGLDNFLTEQTSSEMKRIEEDTSGGRRENLLLLRRTLYRRTQRRPNKEVREAEASRKKGFIKLGYNLVLRELERKTLTKLPIPASGLSCAVLAF